MPEPGGEGEEPQPDAGAQARECAGAVALEAELSLAGPKDRFDPLAHAPERSELERLVLAIGTKELGSAIGHPALELGAGEALVGDDGEAGERDPLEHLARDLSLGSICRGELEGHRGPVARAEQIEAKAPEVREQVREPRAGDWGLRRETTVRCPPPGEVSEWSKERDWKSRICRKVG